MGTIILFLLILMLLFKILFGLGVGLIKGLLAIITSLVVIIFSGVIFAVSLPIMIIFCVFTVALGLLKFIF